MALMEHRTGNYHFLPGIAPYSCGVVASPGHEIVHVTWQHPLSYRQGFDQVAALLDRLGRPRTALCSVSLRCPAPYSFRGFGEFNAEYEQLLRPWGVFVDGINPVARTNIAPLLAAPAEPVLYGFAFTRPGGAGQRPTFVVAGAGELPEGFLERSAIVALGDTSPDGLATKARFVMQLMTDRLRGLGCDWSEVSTANVYTAHPVDRIVPDEVLRVMGSAAIHGVRWHASRPPVEEIEFEMDVRGTRTEWSL